MAITVDNNAWAGNELLCSDVGDSGSRNSNGIPGSQHSAETIYVLTDATVLTACDLRERW